MTATRPPLLHRPPVFLRRALLLDVVGTDAVAILLAIAPAPLAELLGISQMVMHGCGVFLLVYVGYVLFVATRPRIARPLAWSIIGMNAAWAAASFVVVVQGILTPTPIGVGFVAAQAAAVVGFAALQFVGLQKADAR